MDYYEVLDDRTTPVITPMSSQGELLLLTRMTAASRGQQINTKYKQISKVVHMFLPEIQTKSISLSASAQISILLRSESEWAQKR